MGLGLSLVRRLTELHGGTVDVTSSGLGRGSRFAVHLPLHSRSVANATIATRGEVLAIVAVSDVAALAFASR